MFRDEMVGATASAKPLQQTVVDDSWPQLLDVATGAACLHPTRFRWYQEPRCLVLDVIAECSVLQSRFRNANDPLYEADVIEVFLHVQGAGRRYLELEASPAGCLFDAWIDNRTDLDDPLAERDLHTYFNAPGPHRPTLETLLDGTPPVELVGLEGGLRVSEWRVRFTIPWVSLGFGECPGRGQSTHPVCRGLLRCNVFRIQHYPGGREYQAWRPTGMLDFHRPQHFGTLSIKDRSLNTRR